MRASNAVGEAPVGAAMRPAGSCLQRMDAFDRLPKPVRDVLREAPIDYHAAQIHELLAAFRRYRLSDDQIAEIMRKEIPSHLTANVIAAWGSAHPQARISL